MCRKAVITFFFLCIAILSIQTYAQEIKLSLTTTKESYGPEESIIFKISLLDSQNNPINDNVTIVLEDVEKRIQIEKVVQSNKFVDINLGENKFYGYWKINAEYSGFSGATLFLIETEEKARFEIKGDILTVINIGNSRYTKTIQIMIGDSLGTKKLDLNIGEKISFRIVAPEGVYNVKVTDGKTQIERSGVPLTGNVVGILDERLKQNPITGGLSPEEPTLSDLKSKKAAFAFLIFVIGGIILLVIESVYERRIKKKKKKFSKVKQA